MKLGIEAVNIKGGGGVTHLTELIRYSKPGKYGITEIIIWASQKTLDQIPNYPWINKIHHPFINGSFIKRFMWIKFFFPKQIKNCDVALFPGGVYSGSFKPFVAMSQNMLYYDKKESDRYGMSFKKFRLFLLRNMQRKSFGKAEGIIFLSRYASDKINASMNLKNKNMRIISHGISERFSQKPKLQYPIEHYSRNEKLEILYVSNISLYKHHYNVITAVYELKKKGLPIKLTLIGKVIEKVAYEKLKEAIDNTNTDEKLVDFYKEIEYNELDKYYKKADVFLFASTCENLPNIVIEAMSAGLPIASSYYGPMGEVLKDSALFFDPLSITDIRNTIEKLIMDKDLRKMLADKAYEYSKQYTWEKCADETLNFIMYVFNKYHKINLVV